MLEGICTNGQIEEAYEICHANSIKKYVDYSQN